MHLTPAQLADFDREGFIALPALFTPNEVALLRREADRIYAETRQEVVREKDGVIEEPMELLLVDVPEDYVGIVTQLLGVRRGVMSKMDHIGGGRVRISVSPPCSSPIRNSSGTEHPSKRTARLSLARMPMESQPDAMEIPAVPAGMANRVTNKGAVMAMVAAVASGRYFSAVTAHTVAMAMSAERASCSLGRAERHGTGPRWRNGTAVAISKWQV